MSQAQEPLFSQQNNRLFPGHNERSTTKLSKKTENEGNLRKLRNLKESVEIYLEVCNERELEWIAAADDYFLSGHKGHDDSIIRTVTCPNRGSQCVILSMIAESLAGWAVNKIYEFSSTILLTDVSQKINRIIAKDKKRMFDSRLVVWYHMSFDFAKRNAYSSVMNNYLQCSKTISNRQQTLQCETCERWQHRTCDTSITQAEYRRAVRGETILAYVCNRCIQVAQKPMKLIDDTANDEGTEIARQVVVNHINKAPAPSLPIIENLARQANRLRSKNMPVDPTDSYFELNLDPVLNNFLKKDFMVEENRHIIFATDQMLQLMTNAKT
ncbi:hypothetical protein A3Q56_07923 [Intoshia linei]|uniref:Uncharacterized protein n=1 Tax=Intoshia linei TaxID=1819745 RepID=A0A177AQK9_9BILA|nr:hypothetical protein A3Q56_07923 [Intoshia linei]